MIDQIEEEDQSGEKLDPEVEFLNFQLVMTKSQKKTSRQKSKSRSSYSTRSKSSNDRTSQ